MEKVRGQKNIDEKHLDWTSKQGRILTCDGKAPIFYSPERGFPYRLEDLPHHHLVNQSSHKAFESFCIRQHELILQQKQQQKKNLRTINSICGVWKRPLFTGSCWEHTTDNEDTVFNIQTNTLFIDLRIPTSKPDFKSHISLETMTNFELRMYARQHAFAGFTCMDYEHRDRRRYDDSAGIHSIDMVCTRHHVIDWNYIPGHPRNRPNKWFVECCIPPTTESNDKKKDISPPPVNVWKEFSYARDDFDQHYYYERWERLPGDDSGKGFVLAMRKAKPNNDTIATMNDKNFRDGIVVIVGDHFNYIFDRSLKEEQKHNIPSKYKGATSLVSLVDQAVSQNDRETAISFLSLDAGHGRIVSSSSSSTKSKWVIDHSLQPWKHGTTLFNPTEDEMQLICSSNKRWSLIWNNEKWDILECSLNNISDLSEYFSCDKKKSKL